MKRVVAGDAIWSAHAGCPGNMRLFKESSKIPVRRVPDWSRSVDEMTVPLIDPASKQAACQVIEAAPFRGRTAAPSIGKGTDFCECPSRLGVEEVFSKSIAFVTGGVACHLGRPRRQATSAGETVCHIVGAVPIIVTTISRRSETLSNDKVGVMKTLTKRYPQRPLYREYRGVVATHSRLKGHSLRRYRFDGTVT